MNLVELDRALRQLRLSGMAAVLETRLRQAQSDKMPTIDLVSASSPTNSSGGKTACSTAATSSGASAIPIAHSTASILISTRK